MQSKDISELNLIIRMCVWYDCYIMTPLALTIKLIKKILNLESNSNFRQGIRRKLNNSFQPEVHTLVRVNN